MRGSKRSNVHDTLWDRELHWVNGVAEKGWFQARSVQGQVLNGTMSSRAEVVLRSGAGETPKLTSSVDHRLAPVYYRDMEGTLWYAAGINPGEVVGMQKAEGKDFDQWQKQVVQEPSEALRGKLNQVIDRKGWFFAAAVMEGGKGFWVPTEPGIRWKRDQAVYVGPVQKEVR